MSSKTFVLAAMATLAAQSVAFSVPACWQTCFDKHNVTTEDVLCENSAVNSCVGYLCHETDAAAAGDYTYWLASYCAPAHPAAPSNTAATAYSTASSNATVAYNATTSVSLPTYTAVASASAAPIPYSNATSLTPSYTKSAVASGAAMSSTGSVASSTATGTPYTGGAAGTAASMVLVAGGFAASFLL